MNLPLWVAIPVVALLIPIIAIVMDGMQKIKEREHTHRERIKAMEMGVTQALPTLNAAVPEEPTRGKPRSAGYHGAVWTGLGGGLFLSTMLVRYTSHDPDAIKIANFMLLWSFPAFCIGLGLLLYAGVNRRNRAGGE